MPSRPSHSPTTRGSQFLLHTSGQRQHVALFFEHHALTAGEVTHQSLAFASALRRLGVQPGDRVALLLPNLPEFITAFFGILGTGAFAVPMNPTDHPPEIRQIFRETVVTAAVVWSKSWRRVQQAIASQGMPRLLILVSWPGRLPRSRIRFLRRERLPKRWFFFGWLTSVNCM